MRIYLIMFFSFGSATSFCFVFFSANRIMRERKPDGRMFFYCANARVSGEEEEEEEGRRRRKGNTTPFSFACTLRLKRPISLSPLFFSLSLSFSLVSHDTSVIACMAQHRLFDTKLLLLRTSPVASRSFSFYDILFFEGYLSRFSPIRMSTASDIF